MLSIIKIKNKYNVYDSENQIFLLKKCCKSIELQEHGIVAKQPLNKEKDKYFLFDRTGKFLFSSVEPKKISDYTEEWFDAKYNFTIYNNYVFKDTYYDDGEKINLLRDVLNLDGSLVNLGTSKYDIVTSVANNLPVFNTKNDVVFYDVNNKKIKFTYNQLTKDIENAIQQITTSNAKIFNNMLCKDMSQKKLELLSKHKLNSKNALLFNHLIEQKIKEIKNSNLVDSSFEIYNTSKQLSSIVKDFEQRYAFIQNYYFHSKLYYEIDKENNCMKVSVLYKKPLQKTLQAEKELVESDPSVNNKEYYDRKQLLEINLKTYNITMNKENLNYFEKYNKKVTGKAIDLTSEFEKYSNTHTNDFCLE